MKKKLYSSQEARHVNVTRREEDPPFGLIVATGSSQYEFVMALRELEQLKIDVDLALPTPEMVSATRNELIDALMKAYELETPDVASAVELYYDAQQLRIQHANKKRTEPPRTLNKWMDKWLGLGEIFFGGKLKQWVLSDRAPAEAKWALDQVGIGHILAAGLAAHIDVEKAQSPSAVWKFAGQAPGYDRKIKGQKLPYNSRLKVLCWKLGESFVKVSGKEDALYGHLYAEFKAEEVRKNEAGLLAEAAAKELRTKKITDKETKAILESGHLTDGQLHSRAKRKAVKIFLVHYWTKGRLARGLSVRGPYVQTILGHDGIIPANDSKSPVDHERAHPTKSTKVKERATQGESPMPEERADKSKSSIEDERAQKDEPPNKGERAKESESPLQAERAPKSEPPNTVERAHPPEKPIRKERKKAA
jgi:hypothetical protein